MMLKIHLLQRKMSNPFRIGFFVSALCISLFSGNVCAQEIYDLSRCIVTGLEQNFSVKVARNQEEISENNYSRGNAGFFPTVTTTNRYGGNVTSTTQNMNDGSQRKTSGIHNSTGSAALNLDMPLFRGFSI